MDRLPLLYDEDCGVCRALMVPVLLWDRGHRLRPVALGSPEAAELLAPMERERQMRSWHLDTPSGVRSAGAALPDLLDILPGGAPLAALTRRVPALTERGYRLIADNRSHISPLVPDSARRRADVLIAKRA